MAKWTDGMVSVVGYYCFSTSLPQVRGYRLAFGTLKVSASCGVNVAESVLKIVYTPSVYIAIKYLQL